MEKKYSSTWKSSTDTAKQRKYIFNAPRHIKDKFLTCCLSKALKKEHGIKNLRVKTKDTVKIMRGDNKGKTGEVIKVDLKNTKIYIKGISQKKVNGQDANIPIRPSNLQIIELDLKDEKRLKSIKKTVEARENKNAAQKKAEPKAAKVAPKAKAAEKKN